MRTPVGKECPHFYGDYYRGRNREECRLIENWIPKLCNTCPVPGIHLANACQHMHLIATVRRPFFILTPVVHIRAYCRKTERVVTEPQIGCGRCHALPEIFTGDSIDPNTHASD